MARRKPKHPWDRRPGEPSSAHASLRQYLELGAERSMVRVREIGGKSLAALSALSGKYEWVARSEAYDSHVAGVEQAARDKVRSETAATWERRRLESLEGDYTISLKLREKATAMLGHPLTEEKTADGVRLIVPGKWSLGNAAVMAKVASELASAAVEAALADAELDAFDPGKATPEEAQSLLDRIAARRRDRDTSGRG